MMKIDHSALPHPERSWLRKMSLKTTISSQIQMKNRKNQSIDQKTCPVPNSASITYLRWVDGRAVLAPPWVAAAVIITPRCG